MAKSVNMGIGRKVDTWLGPLICALLYFVSRVRGLLGGPPQPAMHATTPPLPGGPPLRPRRVLAIKTYGLGNIAMILSVISALRREIPEVEVDFLTLPENRSLLELSGLVRRVLAVDTTSYGSLAGSLLKNLRDIITRRYDVVIDFEQFVKLSAIIAFLSGAPHRFGFNTDGQRRGWLYTTRIVYTDSEHMSQTFMRLLRPLQIDTSPGEVTFATGPESETAVQALLDEHGIAHAAGPLIVVHVGSGPNFYDVPLKRWPIQYFAELADALVERYGAAVLFTGKGEEEHALVHEAMRLMRRPAVDACDRLDIAGLLALLRRADLTVCNDTSVVHLAVALRSRVAVVFGPTDPLQYGPPQPEDLILYQDLYCSPCLTNYNLKVSYCANPVCIRSIPAERALSAIEKKYFGENASTPLTRPGEGAATGLTEPDAASPARPSRPRLTLAKDPGS
ncbi:MAG: glycosyltransferase family 9 protein [Deltaproteobacteria bacterium]|nr:glycosyltransferase family 9 protein [Deltaproteobacteria bacterium]MBW2420905.1 glycosyltransferase family 9 protein [Deltaproteobacteria bacterium]